MRFRNTDPEARVKARWIPQDSVAFEHIGQLGIAYIYPCGSRIGVVGYCGTGGKPSFHHSYRTQAQMIEDVSRYFNGWQQHKKIVEDYRAERSKPHTLKVGDIITNSWGYDQTNVDWYRISRVSTHFVWLKPICGHTVDSDGFAPMAGQCVPAVDTSSPNQANWGFKDCDEPEEKHYASGSNVTMKFGSGSKWDGRAKYCSWYA